MSVALNAALTGLRAFDKKLDVTAHNTANVNTDGFKKSRAVLQEDYPSGVKVSVEKTDTPGMLLPVEAGSTEMRESSNVSLEDGLLELLTTQYGYESNLKVVETEEEILGELLNIKV